MGNYRRSMVIFEIWGWNRQRIADFVNQYVNYPLKKYGITLTPEELFTGTVGFVLDFDNNAEPEQAWENLEDYLDSILNNFAENGEEFVLHHIDRNRILTAFNDLAEFISSDILLAFDKARLRWPIDIISVTIRRNAFTITTEDPSVESLW